MSVLILMRVTASSKPRPLTVKRHFLMLSNPSQKVSIKRSFHEQVSTAILWITCA